MENYNEDIEILDFDDEIDFKKNQQKEQPKDVEEILIDEEKNSKKKKTKSKKEKLSRTQRNKNKRTRNMQIAFCCISTLFILGCCIFYGSRLIKYYRIYNPKADNGEKIQLLAGEITDKSEIVYESNGLYINAGNYIYKGDVDNNYIKFSNMLWRIVRVNKDDTIEIILDDYINMLNWDSESVDYLKSDIYDYLNKYFVERIDKNMLVNATICTDKVDKLSSITCDEKNSDSLVNLLDVTNFLNSVVDNNSYLAKNDEIYWLRNYSSESVWHTNGSNVSQSAGNNFYGVRPTVILKATTVYNSGKGTIEEPYIVGENNKITVGSYVKLGEDLWTVYENSDNFKLTLSSNLDRTHRFSYTKNTFDTTDEGSIAEYLNTTYLESLTYQDKLLDSKWYVGEFKDSYKDVLTEEVTAKVGLLNLADLKIDSSIDGYFLSTSNDELIYVYGSVLRNSKTTISRNIRPCIAVSNSIKVLSGSGSEEDPFILEV